MTTIAMWSGPRNISTAMMYSFASRADCTVWDEPFYAHYLSATGITHPVGDEVIAAGETGYDAVVDMCLAEPAAATPVFYQKHMTHHMLPGQDWRWCLALSNVFLIRSPERVLASYAAKREEVLELCHRGVDLRTGGGVGYKGNSGHSPPTGIVVAPSVSDHSPNRDN